MVLMCAHAKADPEAKASRKQEIHPRGILNRNWEKEVRQAGSGWWVSNWQLLWVHVASSCREALEDSVEQVPWQPLA